MIADIHAQGFAMTQALAYNVWRWPGLALRPYSDRMQRDSVGVGYKNGPRGGVDKFCRIQVYLIGKNLERTHRVRDAARCCHEIQKPTHAHGDIK